MKDQKYYVEKLNQVYEEHYSDNGICPFFDKCSEGMEKPKILFDFATRVGENYGSGKYPKVLMLGQEGTNSHTTLEEPCRTLDDASKQHYPKTLYTLAMILKREQPKSWARKDLRMHEELFTHFALTNYYKCAFSDDPEKVNGLQHNKSMKDNCFKLLLKEMDVLEPNLLVVQGKFTTESFWNALNQFYDKGICLWENKTAQSDISLYQHKLKGKPFYILYSYHPAGIAQWSRTLNDLKTAIDHFCHAYDLDNN